MLEMLQTNIVLEFLRRENGEIAILVRKKSPFVHYKHVKYFFYKNWDEKKKWNLQHNNRVSLTYKPRMMMLGESWTNLTIIKTVPIKKYIYKKKGFSREWQLTV